MGKKKTARTSPRRKSVERTRKPKADGPTGKASQATPLPAAEAVQSSKPSAPSGFDALSGEPRRPSNSFPIVGVGASAGGLEAFRQLLEHLPTDTGMAFVLIQHLDPNHESILPEILARSTRMPVRQVTEGMALERNHVFVIPPNTNMAVVDGVLALEPRQVTRGLHMPIDYFFRSLAKVQGSEAIGVILSGAASDGALGLAEIKAVGGITFAQDERSASHSDMPRSAIATGVVDFVLPPHGIAQELAQLGRHSYVAAAHGAATAPGGLVLPDEEALPEIFKIVKEKSGVDFTHYKYNTLKRRIARRMALHKMEGLNQYVKLLHRSPSEATALYQELLINVTSFFRDPEVFQALKEQVYPKLVANRTGSAPLRIWVPGCASGEEAYSLAICLLEFLQEQNSIIPIQIFATDLNESTLEKARSGVYLQNIALDVSPERLRRYFTEVEGKYQITKQVRDLCIFARQDLVQDAPFSRLDLISCRNVMIYLGAQLQRRVLSTFHYALKPQGFLLLGSAEAAAIGSDIFTTVDIQHRIYSNKTGRERALLDFSFGPIDLTTPITQTVHKDPKRKEPTGGLNIYREAERLTLARFAPASVLVDENMEIIHVQGDTGPYLTPAEGRPSFNLMKMAREGLIVPLTATLKKAKGDVPARQKGVRLKVDNQLREVAIEVIPFKPLQDKQHYFLVFFEETALSSGPQSKKYRKARLTPTKSEGKGTSELRMELSATKQYLQTIIEQQEGTNEELRAANEEILSSNEELQSTNEELQTAKEELQSANEELQSANEELRSVNEELQNRNTELNQTNNDLRNLMEGTKSPILVLGRDLHIRRFTTAAEKIFNLIPADAGRAFVDIKHNLTDVDLERLISEAIDEMKVRQLEVQDKEGCWYDLQIRPYKTEDNRIDGAVVSLFDITELRRAREYLRLVTDSEPRLILSPDLRVVSANPVFSQSFEINPVEAENQPVRELGNQRSDIPKLLELLGALLPANAPVRDVTVEGEFPNLGRRKMQLSARRLSSKTNQREMVLLSIEAVTKPN
jgi:two-component system CheB/CheR fusion protein